MRNYYIFLIRCGLTAANETGAYCGAETDEPLSEFGRANLIELSSNCAYPTVERVYTSPMLRAVETANILYPYSEIVPVDTLREAALGRFSGRTIYELRDDDEYARWVTPKSEFTPDGVEPPREFFERCYLSIISIIEQMMSEGLRSAAVVTHASVIGNAMTAFCLPKRPPYEWGAEAGCGFKLATSSELFSRDGLFEIMGEVPRTVELSEDYDG